MKDGIEMAAKGVMDKSVQRFWEKHRIINAIHELPSSMFGIMEILLLKCLTTLPDKPLPNDTTNKFRNGVWTMKFNPGQLVVTRGVNDLIADNEEFAARAHL